MIKIKDMWCNRRRVSVMDRPSQEGSSPTRPSAACSRSFLKRSCSCHHILRPLHCPAQSWPSVWWTRGRLGGLRSRRPGEDHRCEYWGSSGFRRCNKRPTEQKNKLLQKQNHDDELVFSRRKWLDWLTFGSGQQPHLWLSAMKQHVVSWGQLVLWSHMFLSGQTKLETASSCMAGTSWSAGTFCSQDRLGAPGRSHVCSATLHM